MRWVFGDFVLDSEAYDLRLKGESLAVEPRVFDLLAYLIEHRDRVVSKDELLLEVWQGQHVSESALTQSIYEARRALGDDASQQERLKTVYGRGYQFVAPITEADGESSRGVTESGVAEVIVPESRPSARRWLWPAALLMVALLVAGLLAWDRSSSVAGEDRLETTPLVGGDSDGGVPGTVNRLAIVPFSVDDDRPDAALTALSVSDQLWYQLASQPGLVVRTLEMGAALQAAELPWAVMLDEAQVDAVLSGHLESSTLGERFQLTVRLHERAPDRRPRDVVVGTYEIPAQGSRSALERFVKIRNAIAADVVEHLRPTMKSRDLIALSPHDPEAWRLYLQARERFATITCGDADALLELLDQSLRLDPEFAVAWVAKGFALYSQSWACGREAAFNEQALEAARRARELAPEFPAAVYLEVTLRVEAGEAEEAYSLLLEQWNGIERSPFAHLARAYALRYAGFLRAATEQVERALELDPLVLVEFDLQPTSYLYLGEVEQFLEHLPATDVPADRYYRGLAQARMGRMDEARATLDPAFRLNPTDLFARFSSSLVATLEDDAATGLEIVREIVRQREELGTPDGEMTFKEAQLLARAGSGDEALVRLQSAVEAGFFCPRCFAGDPAFSVWRDDPRFLDVIERARERHRAFASRFDLEVEDGSSADSAP